VAYLGYSIWISLYEPNRTLWPDRVGIAATMYLIGLYIALIGLVTERLRQRTRQAIRTARALVSSLEQKPRALELQAAELERARRQAEEASLAKSQFLAVTSHEIRTPMNGILGAAELLIATSLTPTQQHYVRIATRSASTLLALIDDVLDLSRIEAGKLRLTNTSVDLRALVTEAVDLVEVTARDKPVELSCAVSPEPCRRGSGRPLAAAPTAREPAAQRGQVHRSRHGPPRGAVLDEAPPARRVRFPCATPASASRATSRIRIFGAFNQVDASSTRRHGGSGLGLAIVKELAELMGGQVQVESQVGAGSHFWIDLLLQELPAEAAPAAGGPWAMSRTGRSPCSWPKTTSSTRWWSSRC
jgi:signal transduction histidine kinase